MKKLLILLAMCITAGVIVSCNTPSSASKDLIQSTIPSSSSTPIPSATYNPTQTPVFSPPKSYLNRVIIDDEYKLFYGDWIITERIATHMREDPIMGDLSGTTISYRRDSVISNKEIIGHPEEQLYKFAILPITDIPFFMFLPDPVELGFEGNYFVFVAVTVAYYEPELIGTWFYIKDDETLIIFVDNCYYEAKRVSHIENYELKLEHI